MHYLKIKLLLIIAANLMFGYCFSQNPKNIIIVVADGAGYNHFEALRNYTATDLACDNYNVKYGVATYAALSTNLNGVKDTSAFSAYYETTAAWKDLNFLTQNFSDRWSASTAMATGKKTALQTIGVGLDSANYPNIFQQAFAKGKKTGLVSNLPITEMGISSFCVNTPDVSNKTEILKQLISSEYLNVLIAAGHPLYDNDGNVSAADYSYFYSKDVWDSLKAEATSLPDLNITNSEAWKLADDELIIDTIGNNASFNKILGVVNFKDPRKSTNNVSVNFSGLTLCALRNLSNSNGFVLVVESGVIDTLTAQNKVSGLITELSEFNKTIETINNWVDANGGWNENLVIVTSSYETGLICKASADFSKSEIFENLQIEDAGKGVLPEIKSYTDNPVNTLVPVYANGAGSSLFQAYANDTDKNYGRYINNTEIGQLCFQVLEKDKNVKKPKNIILMIGDGMGYNHIKSAEYYTGKTAPFRNFPVWLSSATYKYHDSYCSKDAWTTPDYFFERNKVTCSAASGTALATGIKSKEDAIAVDPKNNVIESITMFAHEAGYATGVVTNMPAVDATPANFASNNVDRDNKIDLMRDALIEGKLDVLMGCGHPYYDDNAYEKYPYWEFMFTQNMWTDLKGGATKYSEPSMSGRTDVQDIDGDNIADAWTLVDDSLHFVALANGDSLHKRVCGIAKVNYTLQQKRQNKNNIADTRPAYTLPFNKNVPLLSTMAKGALNVLSAKNKGFFVMIEGGAIDQTGHYNQPGIMIEEMIDFHNTIDTVIAWIENNGGWDENLLIITADHETGYVVNSGFPDSLDLIAANIAGPSDKGVGNMPGFVFKRAALEQSTPFHHTNQLVPFYAKGPSAQIFESKADEYDFVRGAYLTNAEVGQTLFEIMGGNSGKIINNVSTIVAEIPDLTAYLKKDFEYQLPSVLAEDKEDGTNLRVELKTTTTSSWVKYDKEQNKLYGLPPKVKYVYVYLNIFDGTITGHASQSSLRININVVDNTDIIENEELSFDVFPNPATNYVTVGLHGDLSSAQLSIYNSLGENVINETLTKNNTLLNLSALAKGNYSVVVKTAEGKIFNEKLIIK